tara:strand:+ start:180 stop:422 length:243 start_codon:yes stop_codon:yes gene_type:complete
MSYDNLNTFMEKRAGIGAARKIGKTLQGGGVGAAGGSNLLKLRGGKPALGFIDPRIGKGGNLTPEQLERISRRVGKSVNK